jgi:hypothetical protein
MTGKPGNYIFVLYTANAATYFETYDRIIDFESGLYPIQLSPGLTFAELSL